MKKIIKTTCEDVADVIINSLDKQDAAVGLTALLKCIEDSIQCHPKEIMNNFFLSEHEFFNYVKLNKELLGQKAFDACVNYNWYKKQDIINAAWFRHTYNGDYCEKIPHCFICGLKRYANINHSTAIQLQNYVYGKKIPCLKRVSKYNV